jgi:glutaredoxin 3
MLLTKKRLSFDDIKISGDGELSEEMLRLSGSRSVPQIFVNDQLIGGFDELSALDKSGDLDRLVGQ